MKKSRLLMTSPPPNFTEIAKKEGFYLVVIWDKKNRNEDNLHKVIRHADELYFINFEDKNKVENLINWIHSIKPIDYMYHLGKDEDMEFSYRVAEKYGLNLNSVDSIIRMNNKFLMREYLNYNNLSVVQYKATSMDRIEKDVSEFNQPFIIKPFNLSGSRGVYLCQSKEDLKFWKNYMSYYEYDGDFIIEEFLNGKEVSVETLSFKGEHYIVGITDKIKTDPPLFVEVGHVFPSQLEEHIQESIRKLATEALDLLHYQFGPTHIEIIITKDGPKIVEMHARLAGDRIPLLIKYAASGLLLEKEIINMLNGKKPDIRPTDSILKIHFFQWRKGKIKEINGLDKAKLVTGVKLLDLNVHIDKEIQEAYDSFSRHGFVIVSGNTLKEIDETIDKVENLISIEYYDL